MRGIESRLVRGAGCIGGALMGALCGGRLCVGIWLGIIMPGPDGAA